METTTDRKIVLFMSYSRYDSLFVDALDDTLRSRGFGTWVDRSHLEGSDEWQQRIETALRQSDGVLVVIPPAVVETKWVRREIEYATRAAKTIVPVRLRA